MKGVTTDEELHNLVFVETIKWFVNIEASLAFIEEANTWERKYFWACLDLFGETIDVLPDARFEIITKSEGTFNWLLDRSTEPIMYVWEEINRRLNAGEYDY